MGVNFYDRCSDLDVYCILDLVRTVADVIGCYKEVVRLISDGYSRNQALKASKKQLTSFNRVKHIYQLYVTRPERLVQVSGHGMITVAHCI